jgi:2-polyprenyl-3-methyl-5-hydroxy-6-metoxy-1,4-benzoquinol methylase
MAGKICPPWVGYLLASPVRRLLQNPEKILAPYVEEGMTALDIGCAMGFFSLPLARMVGEKGKVVCADVQEKMLQSLRTHARRAGLADRIITHLCPHDSLALDHFEKKIDFALVFAVVHEVPDAFKFFRELSTTMKPGSKCLLAEPKWHVSEERFSKTLAEARENGLQLASRPAIATSRAALVVKTQR